MRSVERVWTVGHARSGAPLEGAVGLGRWLTVIAPALAVVGLLVVVLDPSPDVMTGLRMLGLALGALGLLSARSLRQVQGVAERAARAAHRDRSLLEASRRMGDAVDQPEVDEVVADVARDLVDQPGASAIMWEEQGDVWVAIASAGPARLEVAATARLPEGMMERLATGEPWILDEHESAALQRAYDLDPVFQEFVYVPVPRRHGARAVLAMSCPRPPDVDLLGALRRFVQEVSLAEDRARLVAELADREAELTSLLQGSTDIIGMLDEQGTITYINRATRAAHGYEPEELLGTNVFDLFHPDDRGRVLHETLSGDLDVGVQVAHRMFDAQGRLRHVETWVSRPAGATAGYILNVRDVTDRKALEAEIHHHAHHDALTGVANRRAFTARMEEALARFARNGVSVGLIMLDLDDFKPVNDTWGHQAGDEALVEVARRLTEAVRETDVVARMGGDEFAVILEAAGEPNEVATLAARIEAAISAPMRLDRGATCRITASVGFASSWAGCDADELLREADQKLYVSKAARQGQGALPSNPR